jgi:hypothetical protein
MRDARSFGLFMRSRLDSSIAETDSDTRNESEPEIEETAPRRERTATPSRMSLRIRAMRRRQLHVRRYSDPRAALQLNRRRFLNFASIPLQQLRARMRRRER